MFNNKVHSRWGFHDRINQDQHLIYVKGGEGYYLIEGKEIPLYRGQFIFASRGVKLSAGISGANTPDIMPLRFSLLNGEDSADHLIEKPFFLYKNLSSRGFVEPLLNKLFHLSTIEKKNEIINGQISSLIKSVLYLFLEKENTISGRDRRIEKVLQEIHKTPWKKHNLQELAASCNLSTKQFSRLFQEETQRSPADYIRFFRCQYACEILDNSHLPIQNIAQELSYPDPYTFSKQFKKYTGMSPRQWRARETDDQ